MRKRLEKKDNKIAGKSGAGFSKGLAPSDLPINQIICGDCLEIMKTFPDESVDMVITSPPYWGLRTYGPEARRMWGGAMDCEHEWVGDPILNEKSGKPGPNASVGARFAQDAVRRRRLHAGRGDCQKSAKYSEQEPIPDVPIIESTCVRCGTWYGELGLEPTFQMYLDHLIEIFAEVKRVLKKTGCVFVNLGDTYGGSGGSAGHTAETKNLGRKTFEYGAYPSMAMKAQVPAKSLIGIPERFAIRMTDELGLIRRNTIIWHKKNCLPQSAKDRFTVDFEYLFFFTKNRKYYFEQQFEEYSPATFPRMLGGRSEKSKWVDGPDGKTKHTINQPQPNIKKEFFQYRGQGIKDYESQGVQNPSDVKRRILKLIEKSIQGRNKRCVWSIATKPYPECHFATFSPELIETPIKAGCPTDGIILDPFMGAGTTALVALKNNRNFIGIEINPTYVAMCKKRIAHVQPKLVV